MYQLHQSESRLKPWLFQVEPYEAESFGHFLGRFRRANHLSCSHLAAREHVTLFGRKISLV